jgi:hypothetical protein
MLGKAEKGNERAARALWRGLLVGLCMAAGSDALLFSPLTLHAAGGLNLGQRHRSWSVLRRHKLEARVLEPHRRPLFGGLLAMSAAKKAGGDEGRDAATAAPLPLPSPSEAFVEQGSVFPGEQTAPPGNPEGGWSGVGLAEFLKQFPAIKERFEDEINEMESSIGYDTPGQGQIIEYDPAFLSGWGECA